MRRVGSESWDRAGYADAGHRMTGVLAGLPPTAADREQALCGFLRKMGEIREVIESERREAARVALAVTACAACTACGHEGPAGISCENCGEALCG